MPIRSRLDARTVARLPALAMRDWPHDRRRAALMDFGALKAQTFRTDTAG